MSGKELPSNVVAALRKAEFDMATYQALSKLADVINDHHVRFQVKNQNWKDAEAKRRLKLQIENEFDIKPRTTIAFDRLPPHARVKMQKFETEGQDFTIKIRGLIHEEWSPRKVAAYSVLYPKRDELKKYVEHIRSEFGV